MYPVTVTLTLNSEADLVIFNSMCKAPVDAFAAKDTAKAQDDESTQVTKPEPTAQSASAVKPKTETKKAPETKAPTAAAPAEKISYAQAADAVTKVILNKGRDAGVALLSQFGVATLKDAKPEQYADVIAACEQALAEEGAAA